jgi:RNA polymerase sigma-70 factor (ECF subfamily)
VNPSDREIVDRVLRGDRDGYAELVHRYQGRLFGLVLMMVRRHDAADDVAQETFVRAFTHLEQYDRTRPFYPWLATIGVRLAQNWLRHEARSSLRDAASRRDDEGVAPAAAAAVFADERRRQVWAAVATLSSGERTVVMLHYRDEMSLGDIAQTLGVTTGTVKTLIFRARRHLRERLGVELLRGEWEAQ